MKVKVSVIVPILNSIKYIDECINSILNQDLKEIEILMIDAGSTDGTLERLDEFVKKDSRCRLIHSDLKSCGYQDNLGVKNATGEYIAFVESDDVIIPSMYRELYKEASKYDLDYIKGDFETFYYLQSGERISERFRGVPKEFYNKVIDARKFPQLLLFDMYLWKGIYKRSFIVENGIWQNTSKGAAFQDVGFAFQSITRGKRVMYTDKVYYQYRRDNESSSVYNINGYVYLKNEFLFIEKLIEENRELWRFWSVYYRRLSDMLMTRDKIMVYSHTEWNDMEGSLREIGEIFRRGIDKERISEVDLGEQRYLEIQMLYEDISLYLSNIFFKYQTQLAKWDRQLEKCMEAENVVIFGCGITNKRLFAIMERNGIRANAFCDNQEEKWGIMCCGIPVLSIRDVVEQMKNAVYLIPKKYGHAMTEQLKELGIKDANMVVNDIGLDISAAFVYQYNQK